MPTSGVNIHSKNLHSKFNIFHFIIVFLIILTRCVEAINFTHNPVDAQMDVKLRSLICLGLNEQVCTKYIIYIKYILLYYYNKYRKNNISIYIFMLGSTFVVGSIGV